MQLLLMIIAMFCILILYNIQTVDAGVYTIMGPEQTGYSSLCAMNKYMVMCIVFLSLIKCYQVLGQYLGFVSCSVLALHGGYY